MSIIEFKPKHEQQFLKNFYKRLLAKGLTDEEVMEVLSSITPDSQKQIAVRSYVEYRLNKLLDSLEV